MTLDELERSPLVRWGARSLIAVVTAFGLYVMQNISDDVAKVSQDVKETAGTVHEMALAQERLSGQTTQLSGAQVRMQLEFDVEKQRNDVEHQQMRAETERVIDRIRSQQDVINSRLRELEKAPRVSPGSFSR